MSVIENSAIVATQESDPTDSVVIGSDMAFLSAAAIVAGHKNTATRPIIQSVLVLPSGVCVATDSCRLVGVGWEDARSITDQCRALKVDTGFAGAVCVPASLVKMAAKVAKSGPVSVIRDSVSVTLRLDAGPEFVYGLAQDEHLVDAESFPNLGSIIPDVLPRDQVNPIVPAWVNPAYQADMGKVLAAMGKGQKSPAMFVRQIIGETEHKPMLFELAAKFESGASAGGFCLLMPVRR